MSVIYVPGGAVAVPPPVPHFVAPVTTPVGFKGPVAPAPGGGKPHKIGFKV